MTEISLLIPIFNVEKTITQVINRLIDLMNNIPYSYEIILINDGSTDSTLNKINKYVNTSNIKIISYKNNIGKGHALKHGIKFVNSKYTVFLDGDLEISASNITDYVKSLQNSDIAIASKQHPSSLVNRPIARKIFSLAFRTLVNSLTGLTASDTQSGFKAFKSSAIKKIAPLLSVKKYAFDVELLVIAKILNMKIVELPVYLTMDAKFGVNNIFRMFIDLLGITYRLRIIRWYHKSLNNPNVKYKPIINW